jgi:hypothetical protein
MEITMYTIQEVEGTENWLKLKHIRKSHGSLYVEVEKRNRFGTSAGPSVSKIKDSVGTLRHSVI